MDQRNIPADRWGPPNMQLTLARTSHRFHIDLDGPQQQLFTRAEILK